MALTAFKARGQSDQYWQQLYSSSQGQCGSGLVSLAKQLDDAKKEIEELKKQLKEKK
jgi:hypothetical protein